MRPACRRLQEIDLQAVARVPAANTERAARLAAPPHGAEQVGKDVAEAEVVAVGARPASASPARRRAAAGVGAVETATRLAGSVDFATIELLALLGIADDLISRRDLLEPLFRGGAIGRIEVGMELLGELAIGATDLVFARGARHAKNHVGIFGHRCAHPSPPKMNIQLNGDHGACAPWQGVTRFGPQAPAPEAGQGLRSDGAHVRHRAPHAPSAGKAPVCSFHRRAGPRR